MLVLVGFISFILGQISVLLYLRSREELEKELKLNDPKEIINYVRRIHHSSWR
jgi:hypothetical protein